jgi:anti-anti-sigma regulatory factor
MSNAFFLLILPMGPLTIHLGSYQRNVGMSVRGGCSTPVDSVHLLQAVEQLLESRPVQAWVDCQQLHSLTHLGQHTVLRAAAYARRLGSTLYWCGLPPELAQELQTSEAEDLHLLPAGEYQGPDFLLPERRPPGPNLLAA